jgi:hypothetical protein
MFVQHRSKDPTLAQALEVAKDAAREGHDRAVEALMLTLAEIDRAVLAMSASEERIRASSPDSLAIDAIIRQRTRLENEVRPRLQHELEAVRDQFRTASPFTITLFGRTTAGKSTLMETLVGGDGKSIGKGQQRTTRDVREYTWNNLKIVDVPGVAAFGGDVDEDVAHAAAAKGDLILFLIDDNAPQAVEAKHLAQLALLGRPILGVVNVKIGVDPDTLNDSEEVDDFVERINERFSDQRLDEMIRHLLTTARRYGADLRIDFKSAHLLSRFLSSRADLAHARDRLAKASRFDDIEKHISEVVISRGGLLRHRTFADRVLPSLTDAMKMLWESSRLLRKRATDNCVLASQTRVWLEGFVRDADEMIEREASTTRRSLRSELTHFADTYVEDPEVDQRWQEYVAKAMLPERAEEMQRVLIERCAKKMEGLLDTALRPVEWNRLIGRGSFVESADIWNHRRNMNWFGIAAGAGLAFIGAPLILAVAIPFAFAAGSHLLKPRDEKLARARDALIESREKHLAELEKQFVTHLKLWVRNSLRDGTVMPVVLQLKGLSVALEELAATQRSMAGGLAAACKGSLTWPLVRRALSLAGARWLAPRGAESVLTGTSFEPYIQDVARVPTGLVLLCRSGFELPGALRLELERLFGCAVGLVIDTGKSAENVRQLLASVDHRVRLAVDDSHDELFVEVRADLLPAAMLDLASMFIERPVRHAAEKPAQPPGLSRTTRDGPGSPPLGESLRKELAGLMRGQDSGLRSNPKGKRK